MLLAIYLKTTLFVHKVAVTRVAVRLNDDEAGYLILAAIEDSKACGPLLAVHHVGTCQPTGPIGCVVPVQCTSPRPAGRAPVRACA
jgi:hypothetical protein